MAEVVAMKMHKMHNSTRQEARYYSAYQAADAVNRYIPPLLIIIGSFVNILSIRIMRTNYFRKVSTSLYMIAGSVNDTMGLCVPLLTHWLFLNHPGIFPRNEQLVAMCRFFNFYGFGNTDITILLTAAMTSDRAYAIQWPVRAATEDLRTRAKIVIGVILAVVAVKNIPLLFSSDMSDPNHTERLCVLAANGTSLNTSVQKAWPWIQIIYYGLCLLVILISNIMIIFSVRRSSLMASVRHPGSAEAGRGQQGSPSTRLRQISLMMVLESFTMLVLSYPFSCYLLLTSEGHEKANDPDKVALNRLLFSVFFYMLYSNKCINFFLYLASGKRFRQALVNVLLHCGAATKALAETITLRVRHGVIKVQGQCQGHCQRQLQGQCQGQGQQERREGESGQVANSQTTLSDLPLET